MTETEVIYQHGHFIPKFDSTDHFWFVCEKCGKLAKIVKKKSYHRRSAIYFWLLCPKCSIMGLRKIYLNDNDAQEVSQNWKR